MAAQASIISDLTGYVDRVAKLLRLDAALLSIETKEKLRSIAISIGLLLGAAGVAFLGLVVLLFAVVSLLIELGLAPSLAALLVGVVLLLAAGGLAFVGIQRLKGWSLTPRRTLNQFTNNLHALRASLRDEPNT
jgi:hypothetical protein